MRYVVRSRNYEATFYTQERANNHLRERLACGVLARLYIEDDPHDDSAVRCDSTSLPVRWYRRLGVVGG